MGAAVRRSRPRIFVPGDKALGATIVGMDIGAYSDSIADLELRDAVANVAALLSLHGNVIQDLDAGGSRWRRAGRTPRPDIVVSVPGHRPHSTYGPSVTFTVGTTATGRELTVLLSARPGFDRELLDLAGIIEADQPASRRTDASAT
ncbi:MAG: hypothetical protein ABW224_03420 [Kibdelosporangium sp.]